MKKNEKPQTPQNSREKRRSFEELQGPPVKVITYKQWLEVLAGKWSPWE